MFSLIASLAAALLASSILAQPHDMSAGKREAMKQLAFLVGRWEGGGWIEMNGRRSDFKGVEVVEEKAGGTVLAVEGRHSIRSPDSADDRVIHEAFAVFSYDEAAHEFRFDSHLANGRSGTFAASVKDGVVTWSMDVPQMGTVRYTIKLDDKGRWHEIGEGSSDGNVWIQFFEMTLSRK